MFAKVFVGSDPYSRDSLQVSSLTLDGEGNVSGSVSGDYAAFANRFKKSQVIFLSSGFIFCDAKQFKDLNVTFSSHFDISDVPMYVFEKAPAMNSRCFGQKGPKTRR